MCGTSQPLAAALSVLRDCKGSHAMVCIAACPGVLGVLLLGRFQLTVVPGCVLLLCTLVWACMWGAWVWAC
jgi:hypothetical protein